MAQTNFTPISLYFSTTAAAAPTAGNLVNGELAINITDGKLYYKDNAGVVKVIAGTGGTGVVAGSNTQVQFNNGGVFGASANMVFNGTRLTVADLADSGLTSGRVTYASTGGALVDSANLTFDGTNLGLGTASPDALANFTYSGGGISGTHSFSWGYAFGAASLRLKSTNAGASATVASVGLYSNPERTKEFAFFNQADDSKSGYLGYQYGSGGPITDLTLFNALSGALVFGANNAEQMRLNSTGLGVGTNSPAARVEIFQTSTTVPNLRLRYNSTTYFADFQLAPSGNSIINVPAANGVASGTFAINLNGTSITNRAYSIYANGFHEWNTGTGATLMSLPPTGNLGIGTDSPTVASGTGVVVYNSVGGGAARLALKNGSTGNGGDDGFQLVMSGLDAYIEQRENGFLGFTTNNTERARITAAGNFGVGETAPAWRLMARAASSGTVGVFAFDGAFAGTSEANIGLRFYNGGSASDIPQVLLASYGTTNYTGNFAVRVMQGGTYPNTMVERFTVDGNTGNVGIGTTGPAARLEVSLPSVTSGEVARFSSPSYESVYIAAGASATSCGIGTLSSSSFNLFVNSSSRLLINSSGNVGIGTSSPSARLTVGGGWQQIFNGSSSLYLGDGVNLISGSPASASAVRFDGDALLFGRSNIELARITSGGRFLVGTTTATYPINFRLPSDSGDWFSRFSNTNSNQPYGHVMEFTAAAPNGNANEFLFCSDTSGLKASIRSNGGLANFQANNVNLSDRREKTNFAPAKSYLDTICAIPVQTFNYIDQNMEEDGGLTLGVIAQDVQAVAPELVMESNWGSKEDPKMRLSIYQTDLQYALMKALQELKAEFDAYKASHP